MHGAAHTWRRLRRWYVLACWRARLHQLQQLIPQIEQSIADDTTVLTAIQAEQRLLRGRIEQATRQPAAPAQPLTWGL